MIVLKRYDMVNHRVTIEDRFKTWAEAQEEIEYIAQDLQCYQGFRIYKKSANSVEAYTRECRVRYYITVE